MGISDRLFEGIFGNEVKITSIQPVYGGDINRSYRIILSDGRDCLIKTNTKDALDNFRAESIGLNAIKETGTIGVPEIIDIGTTDEGAYLLMHYVTGGTRKNDHWEMFGHELAAMHSADTFSFVNGGNFGFDHDNYIGSGIQINTPYDKWVDFFRECRLIPQIKRAERYFDAKTKERFDSLLTKLDDILTEPEHPSLLHGDLWSGNFITGPKGYDMLIDPAVYVGDPEADIAMTELFGGYAFSFYDSYKESGLLRYGYKDRRDLYNLYHLLNHLNLFGAGYLNSVLGILIRYTG